jgi:hypothetical protein
MFESIGFENTFGAIWAFFSQNLSKKTLHCAAAKYSNDRLDSSARQGDTLSKA